jgi:transposase
MLTRYRVPVMGDRTREATPLPGMLEDEAIKLSVVASA